MKESVYRKLVSIIHDYRTWIDVLDADRESTFSVRKGGELHSVRCRVLYLVAKVPNSVYPKGHVLSIPEYKLDSAVRSLKRNPDFRSRYQSEALLYTDVEDIVRIASNHFIKLELEP